MSSSNGDPSNKMPWFRSFSRKMKNQERVNIKAQKDRAREAGKAPANKPAAGN